TRCTCRLILMLWALNLEYRTEYAFSLDPFRAAEPPTVRERTERFAAHPFHLHTARKQARLPPRCGAVGHGTPTDWHGKCPAHRDRGSRRQVFVCGVRGRPSVGVCRLARRHRRAHRSCLWPLRCAATRSLGRV